MPKLFNQAGMVMGTIEIILMAMSIYLSTSMLCKAAALTRANSYYETMVACVPNWLGVANTLYMLLLIGNILVYQTFALKNLIPIINVLGGFKYATGSIEYMMLSGVLTIICNLFILPFLFSRHLRFVKVLSNVCSTAVISSFVIILLLFFYPTWFDLKPTPIDWNHVVLARLDGAFVCVGYYLLGFCFQQIAVEIANEIRPRTPRSTDKVILANILVSSAIYLIVSFVGYLTIVGEPGVEDMNNFITYLILDKKNENLALFTIDILVIMSVTFANILNYIPTIKYLKARFNPKPEHLRRLNSAHDPESQVISNEHEQPEVRDLKAYNQRNTLIVWVLFLTVLLVNLIISVFDWRLDFVFNLVSAVGGPAVLIVMPAIFYIAAKNRNPIEPLTAFERALAYGVLVIGNLFWAASIIAVFFA